MSEKLSLPPIKAVNSYLAMQQKRQRGSWWDPKTDKTTQIQKVKELVRHSGQPGHSNYLNPLAFIAPAAEPFKGNQSLVSECEESDSSSSQSIVSPKMPIFPRPPNDRKKAVSDTPRLQYINIKNERSVGIQTENKTMPAETQTDADKASLEKMKESLDHCKKMVAKQNSRLSQINSIVSEVSSDKIIDSSDIKYSLIQYFQEHNLESTLMAFQTDHNIGDCTSNHIRLKTFMKNLDFINALNYVEYYITKEMQRSSNISKNTILMTSYEDLIYVLTKYRFIRLCQKKELDAARITLEEEILLIVQREQQRSGLRGKWFLTDYHLLSALLKPLDISEDNLYGRFNWENELYNFWESVHNLKKEKGSSSPLYAHILLHYFWENCGEIASLEDLSLQSSRWKLFKFEMQKESNKTINEDKKSISKDNIKKPNIRTDENRSVCSDQQTKKSNKRSFRGIRSKISASYSNSSYNGMLINAKKIDEFNNANPGNIMIPIAKEAETAEFALSNCCGPTVSQIKVLEICTGLKDGSFICASAGDDSKSDRCISIWDIRTGTLLKRIDNGSNKAIIILYFHPIYTNLLFSVDMDFDVKLWDWETTELQKHWKKHHSRIIHKIELLPGTNCTMVSCSGDQSLKLWDYENDKIPPRSIHANEPITSFVFCGSPSDPTQQKIVISLSYSIRIYRLRTLGIIHNIALKELKENKTPISMMQSHPIHDNYVLISSDNHLRLFDLLTGTTLRVFATRHIEAGTRVEGRFSPYGNFVYCGNCDLRAYSSLPTKKAHITQYHRAVNGIFIWRVQTGKLEIDDMNAMTGQTDTPAVFVARWGIVSSGSTSRKVLLKATLDKQLRIYY